MRLGKGDLAPRDGKFKSFGGLRLVELKAGEPIAIEDGDELLPGPLRSGDTVPRDGVYQFNLTGQDYELKAGATFPDGGDPAGDFVFARA